MQTMELPQLVMTRASLEGLPPPVVPAGYAIRSYRRGDERAWCRLVSEGIGGDWTPEEFANQIERAVSFQPDDLLFAEMEREVVGTAWAIQRREFPDDTGYVHMVVVAPDHRGRGLGRALVVAVLHRFRDKGLRRAVLRTEDHRLPALRVYLGVGFRPVLSHESHEGRWRRIGGRLDIDEEELMGAAPPDEAP